MTEAEAKMNKLAIEISNLETDLDNKTKELNKLQTENKDRSSCYYCLASIEALMDYTDYHSMCGKHKCVNCRNDNKPCDSFISYNFDTRDKLEEIAKSIRHTSDLVTVLTKLSSDEDKLDIVYNIFKELGIIDKESD